MKKVSILILLCMFINFTMPIVDVYADITFDFKSGNYHVAYIKDNVNAAKCDNSSLLDYKEDNIEYLKSFSTYEEAVSYMNTLSYTDNKVPVIIGDRKDKTGSYVKKILNTKYGLVDLNTTGTDQTTLNVYTSATNNTAYTYINGYGYFGGSDAAFIDYNNGTTRANIKISGVSGWVNSLISSKYNAYDIVPANLIKSPSYYYVNKSGNIVHQLTKKITANNCYSAALTLGPAPSSLKAIDDSGNTIKYYSYDGNYFYTSLTDMLDDYKNGETKKSYNKIPYYNYYMYSPIRTKSNITSDDIRSFLEAYGKTSKDKSALYGEELTFKDAEEKYGVNAAISLSTAINESGWGTSYLAKTKNNLFGHNAYDSSVMESASKYKSASDSIYHHAYSYINTLFAETKDEMGRYYGSHLGNKGSGINVKYASDAYWGEKIAAIYYMLDSYNDMKDYYKYTIGIKVDDTSVEVKRDANTSSKTLYNLKSKNTLITNLPLVILGKVTGEKINGSDVWYKVQTDALLKNERTETTQICTKDDIYNWDENYGYVHSSYITLMDESVNKVYIQKEGLFGLENLTLNSDNTVSLTGYLAIKDIDNIKSKNVTYDLILEEQGSKKETVINLDRILDSSKIPYSIPSDTKYSYEYSWFTKNIDLKEIEQGNYNLYVRARSGGYEAKEVLSNMLSRNIVSKFQIDKKGYQFKTNYYLKTIPIELFVRDEGLISNKNTPTKDNMINQYQDIKLENGNLVISGSSFNVGGDYSKNAKVERKIVFEDTKTFKRSAYDLGYIDNGEYKITLLVPDNKDKTRAWFSNKIDISNLEKGTYAIYIHTIANVDDASELNDIFARSINSKMTINGKNYSLKVNKDQRFRIELVVE